MGLEIVKKVNVQLTCLCGKGSSMTCSSGGARAAIEKSRVEGWTITRHRNGTATVICPKCVAQVASDKQDREMAIKAARKGVRDAEAALKAVMEGGGRDRDK